MYRDNLQPLTDTQMNFVLNQGALGDVITSLPAIIAARRHYANELKMKVWAPSWQEDFVRHLLAPYGEFEILHFEDFPLKRVERAELDMGMVSLNQIPYNVHTRNRTHLVDFAFACLLDSRPRNMLERSYPTEAPLGQPILPGKYVVFPVCATSENKLAKASFIAPVMEWVKERGCAPVIVGTKTSHVKVQRMGGPEPIVMIDEVDKLPKNLYIDMREQTTLLQLRDLCGYAAAVVGVDGGTIHIAGTTDVPIVYAMGTTLPDDRYIARQGDPHRHIRYVGPRNLQCTGCQSRWIASRHDFTKCFYGDSLCMDRLHADDAIAGLKELGL